MSGMSEETRREKEKRVVTEMIQLYCRGQHGTQGELCTGCSELARYARERSECCPFGENKTFCSNCRVHCYRSDMREKIRAVMRYSGPRMLFYHPIMAVSRMAETIRERKKLEKEEKKRNLRKTGKKC